MPARFPRLCGVLLFAAATTLGASAAAQCKPGDHLIGEDADFYYCSTRPCADLPAQIARDQQALARLRDSLLAGSAELKEWAAMNAKAEREAREHAANFLAENVLGSLIHMSEERLVEVEAAFGARRAFGTTWQMQIDRVRSLRLQSARLSGIADGLKIGKYPGLNAIDWWAEVHHWAEEVKGQAGEIQGTLGKISAEPDADAILRKHGVKFVVDGLKAALKPVFEESLSFGQFIVDYGYDAAAWTASRNRIEQNLLNQDKSRIAVCKLSMQLQKSVRDNNICNHRYPAPNSPEPDPANCR